MVPNTGSNPPGELEMTCKTSAVALCCSSASARSSRASLSLRSYVSSCCSRSARGLRIRPTRVFATVPVERSLRPRVGLFAPLRDKITSLAQSLVPLPVGQPRIEPIKPNRTGRWTRVCSLDHLVYGHQPFAERVLRNIGLGLPRQSALMPANLTTLLHF